MDVRAVERDASCCSRCYERPGKMPTEPAWRGVAERLAFREESLNSPATFASHRSKDRYFTVVLQPHPCRITASTIGCLSSPEVSRRFGTSLRVYVCCLFMRIVGASCGHTNETRPMSCISRNGGSIHPVTVCFDRSFFPRVSEFH